MNITKNDITFKKLLIDHYQNRFNKIRENYYLAVVKNDVEGFHELRVQIKQMRAYFNLIESLHCDFEAKKQFRGFRKVFKEAGIVRDIHVQQALVKEFEKKLNRPFPEYTNHLSEQEQKSLQQFFKFSKKFNINVLMKKIGTIEHILGKISKEPAYVNAEKRFDNLIDKLISLRNDENYGEKILHKMRILLKETRYTLEIILECFPEINLNKNLNKALRDLHRILGKWHDNDVGIQFLQSFETSDNNSQEEIIESMRKEKENLVAQFGQKWDDFAALLKE